MKSRMMLLILGTILVTAGFAVAQDDELGVTLDATYVSKYLWRGIDRMDDKAAFQPSVTFDLYGTGFSAQLWAALPGSSGTNTTSTVNATEFDYSLMYDFTMMEGQCSQTDVKLNYIYYDFIDQPTNAADAQELGAGFAWPNLLGNGFTPTYYVGRIWQARSNTQLAANYGGWVHALGLNYDMNIESQVVTLMSSLVYNDGYAGADNDWSHAVFGAKSAFDIADGLSFTPAVYYQISMEDTVNTEDELYSSVSLTYSF